MFCLLAAIAVLGIKCQGQGVGDGFVVFIALKVIIYKEVDVGVVKQAGILV